MDCTFKKAKKLTTLDEIKDHEGRYNIPNVNLTNENKQSYTIDSSNLKDNLNPNFAKITYSEYAVFNNHNFPTSTFIQSKFNNKSTELELKYSDIDFETTLSFPCQIPSSYEKAN